MWLAIETATDRASVAVGFPGAIPAEEELTGARRHAAALVPMIQRALARAGGSVETLEGIAVSEGPGSFTGIRVGVAVAKGLVHTLGVPLWSTPVLMVMAAEARAPGTVLALGDALRGELFAAVYRWAPSRVQCDFGPTVLSPELLLDSIERPDRVVGIASHDLLQELASHWGTVLTAPPASYPRAATLLELVGIEGGAQRVTDPAGWEPEYGRPAEAQRRWEASHGRALPDSPGVAR